MTHGNQLPPTTKYLGTRIVFSSSQHSELSLAPVLLKSRPVTGVTCHRWITQPKNNSMSCWKALYFHYSVAKPHKVPFTILLHISIRSARPPTHHVLLYYGSLINLVHTKCYGSRNSQTHNLFCGNQEISKRMSPLCFRRSEIWIWWWV